MFESKTIFLTGGAQGLGLAYVKRFLEKGANVFFGDVNEKLGRKTEEELQSQYGKDRVVFHPFDVTVGEKFAEAFEKAVSQFGNIDILVNNAGILNEGVWEKMIDINYTATVKGTKLAFDHMRKDRGGKGGRIINISSIIGLAEHPSQPVYCGTKHAVRAFTTSLSMTSGLKSEMGIEVACLCPDVTNTDLITKLDECKMNGYDQMKNKLDARMIQVPNVVEGLFSMLEKDEINGAALLVTKEGSAYQRMERKGLGPDWPPVSSSQ